MTASTDEQTNETASAAPVFQSDLQRLQFEMLDGLVVKRNGLVGRANAAHGDRQSLTEQIRENDQDPEIVKAREQMSAWILKLDELVKPKVDAIIANSAGSVEETEKEIVEIDKMLKPGITFYKKAFDDGTADKFTTQERLKGATVRSGSSGGRRIRGYNVIVTVDGEATEFENFTLAAKHLDVDTSDLQAEFFNKGGSQELKSIPDSVSFTINFEEVDSDGNKVQKDAMVRAYRTEPTGNAGDPNAANGEAPAADAGESETTEPEVDDEVDPFEDTESDSE